MAELVFLKLGGSLITDKDRPYTPRLDQLAELAEQIAAVLASTADLRLVLGHGSGSFGHTVAKKYGTREGISSSRFDRLSAAPLSPLPPPRGAGSGEEGSPSPPAPFDRLRAAPLPLGEGSYWMGFAEVHFQASKLNAFVMEALHTAGIPSMTFPPSAYVIARDQKVLSWETTPIQIALAKGITPVVYGDVAFDEVRGGTILSTEDLFEYLARQLAPDRILLAGLEAGVWEDFPARTKLLNEISPKSYEQMRTGVGGSASADVTGGMEAKVRQMLDLVLQYPDLTAQIFSGEESGALKRALEGQNLGTLVVAE